MEERLGSQFPEEKSTEHQNLVETNCCAYHVSSPVRAQRNACTGSLLHLQLLVKLCVSTDYPKTLSHVISFCQTCHMNFWASPCAPEATWIYGRFCSVLTCCEETRSQYRSINMLRGSNYFWHVNDRINMYTSSIVFSRLLSAQGRLFLAVQVVCQGRFLHLC